MGAKGRPNYPWARMVRELRARPGQWRLFPELVAVPDEVVDRIRRRTVRPLRLDDGKIYARRGVTARSGGRPIADVWLRYLPTEKEGSHEQEEHDRR
jgi:hypothetical protein